MTSAIKDKIFAAIIITLVYTSAAVGIQREADTNATTANAESASEVRAATDTARFGS
jgi:hypothetical protein